MTRSGSFPDRVRVSHTNDRYFRSCAGEQREEDPHGAFRCSGCAAHVRASPGRFVWCWARSRRVRAARTARCAPCRRRLSAKNLAQPLLAGFVSLLRVATRHRASLGRGRVGAASVDRWTQRPPCKSKASGCCSPIVPGRGGPRGSRRARERPSLPPARHPRHRSQRRPLLQTLCCPSPGARLKAAPWPPPRSSATGSRPTCTC